MRNITKSNIKGEWIKLKNSKKNSENNFKYKKLKRQVYRKHRATEKQTIRKYLEEEDPDYVVIINSKIYENLEGKIRKKRRRSSGSSDSGMDII